MIVREGLREAARRLDAGGIADSRREARLLLAAALGCEAGELIARDDRALEERERQRFEQMIRRRLAREPISRIRGYREFWSLRFEITPDTLDPRPDSEAVIEAVLECLADRRRPYRMLDLGVGSGALLLALMVELREAVGLGVDCDPGAVATARRNAAALGLAARVRIEEGDWGRGLEPGFDVIVTNPPYIPSREIAGLMPEVAAYDPRVALDGGADGLVAYRALAPQLARLLAPGGIAALELGAGQFQGVSELMRREGLVISGSKHDLSGVERCMILGQDRAPEKVVGILTGPD